MGSPHFSFATNARTLLPGLELLADTLPVVSQGGIPVTFAPTRELDGYTLSHTPKGVTLTYRQPTDAYRALASLYAGLCPEGTTHQRHRAFQQVGAMIDVSRNGVLHLEGVRKTLRSLALMGINTLQLYTEDVYQLPEEPFFGYARGAYSPEELREIDRYGQQLGIEVIPCIQTLGHLEQILQWPAYSDITDVPGVLLAKAEKTYALIAKKLDTIASCFTTRRVHIGMDEAHGVGEGRYKDIYGTERRFDILNEHLKRVTALCAQRNLHPMMWSDMFFRIGSQNNDYYDKAAIIPDDIIDHIPPSVEMVYWDYYHETPDFYREWIARHRKLGKEPLLATGAWSWGRLWNCLHRTIKTNAPALTAAREAGLKEIFVTVWGDNGAECHPTSSLAAIQYFAELAFHPEADPATLESLFALTTGGSWAAFEQASRMDTPPRIQGAELTDANFGKWILWLDPVLNHLALQIPPELPAVYADLAASTREQVANDHSDALSFAAAALEALALKARLHTEIRACYQSRDPETIRTFLHSVITPTLEAVETLWREHDKAWASWYKPFGWEVIESRYATLASRLRRLQTLFGQLAVDPTLHIEEMEYTLQQPIPEKDYPTMFFRHRQSVTPSVIY